MKNSIFTSFRVNTMRIMLWVLTGIFAFAACVYLLSGSIIAGLFGTLFVAQIILIKCWNTQIKKFVKRKFKPIIITFLAILCLVSFSACDIEDVEPYESASISGSIETNQAIESITDPPSIPTTPPTTNPSTALPTEPTTTQATDSTSPATPEMSSFRIHFIDVGQADAALIECDGHYMLIDGGNKADSNVIYSVLKKTDVPKLDIVVGTHAHEDHIGGLPGAFNYTTADLTLCPVKSYDSNAFEDFVKYANQKSGGITIPSVGDTYSLGSAIVTILGVNGGSDPNDRSIVLRIDYGETSFLFTGDAERNAEQTILNSGANLSATVLKVGHHGSDTSTSYMFLREIMPQYAIISVGTNNSYGHPTEDTLSRLRDAEVTLFRTDLQGDIFCISDGKSLTFNVEKNANADVFGGIGGNSTQTNPTESNPPETEAPPTEPLETEPQNPEPPETEPQKTETIVWIPNSGSKYHSHATCSNMKNPRQVTKEAAISMGYTPCKKCY